ncbi:MAG: ABC transporter ATP-binding protein [Tissierellia bacterium]|nr:ABC transporter ATP-binding protein [Tissierellia bacterium]
MKRYLEEKFGLTETGAKGLLKGSWSFFFYYFSFVPPLLIVFSFVERSLAGKNLNPWEYFVYLVIGAVIMYVITNMNYKITYNETYKEAANLRIDLADSFRKIPLSYFSKHDVSDLAQTIMADVSAMEHALAHALGNCIGFIFYFTMVSVFMLLTNIPLALSVILPILGAIIFLFLSKKKQLQIRKKHYITLRKISEELQSAIEMNQVIQSYGLKEKIKNQIRRLLKESERLQWKSEVTAIVPMTLANHMGTLSIGITIAVGIKLLEQGQITLLYLIGFTIAAAKISLALGGLLSYIGEIFYIDARVRRIREIRNQKVKEGKKGTFKDFTIQLNHVSFAYEKGFPVIEDITFTAKEKEVTALVGPSGCGKTTILRLISKLYDVDTGEIIIGGENIKKVDGEDLFQHISIVFQEVTLFNTSVMENIRIGNLSASDEEVIEVAKKAGCHSFIKELPNRYETLIGENGIRLSGGERQRISIARALLKDAPIIILDEITASLDIENEVKIQDSLKNLLKDKTVIIISHRLKSIENADKIVVLNQGRVDHIGKHEDLMLASKLYGNMIEKSVLTEKFEY